MSASVCDANERATLSAQVMREELDHEYAEFLERIFSLRYLLDGQTLRMAFDQLLSVEMKQKNEYETIWHRMREHVYIIKRLLHPEERLFYVTQHGTGKKHYQLSQDVLWNDYVIAEEVEQRFSKETQRQGFDLEGFPIAILYEVVACFLQNVKQHEYAQEQSWRLVYRVYGVQGGIRIEFLTRGDSPYPEPFIVPGTVYSCVDRPWPDGCAPRGARIKGQTGVGIAVSKGLNMSEKIARNYWGHLNQLITITWDFASGDMPAVPDSRGRDHVITIFIPLKTKAQMLEGDVHMLKAA